MPRPPRSDFAGAWHHVMNRGAQGRNVFSSPSDANLFAECLAEAGFRFEVEVHAYCLMSNHYHLLLRSSGRLSDFMRFAVGRFTRMVNVRDAGEGPLFRGRFTSKQVASDAQLIETSRYIHLNPVRAGLVAQLEDWRWSSARAYLGLEAPPHRLITREILAMFGHLDTKGRYREFLIEGLR